MSGRGLLLITTSYPQMADGSEAAGAFVADFAEAAARHVPVRVVAPGNMECREAGPGGIEVFRFAAPGKPLSLLSPARPTDYPAILRTLVSLRRQTLRAGSDGAVGHTLALWVLPSGWAARVLSRARGVPYSVWALGSDIWSLGRLPGVRGLLRNVIRNASFRFADGLQLGEDAARIAGRGFGFLPSSRRLDRLRTRPLAEEGPYRLLFLGRWHPNKGIDLLLDALAQLEESDWGRIREVHVAGGGPLEAEVRAGVRALVSAGRPVRLDGFLDKAAASAALEAADFLLLPSRIESIPVVFSDALAMRLPVVAMPVGDLPGLLQGADLGEIAGEVTATAFARALSRAISKAPVHRAGHLAVAAARFDVGEAARAFLDAAGLLPTEPEP